MNDDILSKIQTNFAGRPEITFKRGETITFAGESPVGISLLMDGIVEQYDITPEGNKIIVNVFKPYAFFPMSWAINHTTNNYFYAALTEVTLKQADPDKTVKFIQENPDVMFDLLSRVYKGTDAVLKRLVLAASGIAASRLIFELLIEVYRFGEEIDGEHSRIHIKQSALAARSGLARETVSRELHKLENQSLIQLSKTGTIVNLAALEKKLDFSI